MVTFATSKAVLRWRRGLNNRRGVARLLSTVLTVASRGDANREAYLVRLSVRYSDEEIGKIDLDDVAAVVDAFRKGEARGAAACGQKQQFIPEGDLPKYLAEGGLARMPVNGSKLVVERVS